MIAEAGENHRSELRCGGNDFVAASYVQFTRQRGDVWFEAPSALCDGRLNHFLDLRTHLLGKCFAICEKIPHRVGGAWSVLANHATHQSETVCGARVRVIF